MDERPRLRRLGLAVLSAWLLALPASSQTLDSLTTDARSLALDNATSTRLRFSTPTIRSFINEGQRIAAAESECLVKPGATTELVIGTTFYALPSDFQKMWRLTFKHEVLIEKSPEALAASYGRQWLLAKGQPTNYYITFASRTYVGFYPWPDTTSSTGTVRFEYIATTTDMSAGTDEPWGDITELIPHRYILAYYAASRMAAIDGRLDLAVLYQQEWLAGLARLKSQSRDRPTYNPGARPGGP